MAYELNLLYAYAECLHASRLFIAEFDRVIYVLTDSLMFSCESVNTTAEDSLQPFHI